MPLPGYGSVLVPEMRLSERQSSLFSLEPCRCNGILTVLSTFHWTNNLALFGSICKPLIDLGGRSLYCMRDTPGSVFRLHRPLKSRGFEAAVAGCCHSASIDVLEVFLLFGSLLTFYE